MFRVPLLALLLSYTLSASALPLSSQYALVFEEESGRVLVEKNAHSVVPIASITKVITAMTVLDAKQDLGELIRIDRADVDTFKFSSSRVPVGALLSRRELLHLALMSSDNRAAAALARTFPGGGPGFVAAVKKKLAALGMKHTHIEEPTGLSPNNRSTATDLVKMMAAAADYPEISEMSTDAGDSIDVNGRQVHYRNTNRLVGKKGWDIQLSKTGFTREAGRCLVMRVQAAGKHVIVVLLNARASAARLVDAQRVQHFLSGAPGLSVRAAAPRAVSGKAKVKAGKTKALRTKAKSRQKTGKKRRR